MLPSNITIKLFVQKEMRKKERKRKKGKRCHALSNLDAVRTYVCWFHCMHQTKHVRPIFSFPDKEFAVPQSTFLNNCWRE